jgi:hypothetical protein
MGLTYVDIGDFKCSLFKKLPPNTSKLVFDSLFFFESIAFIFYIFLSGLSTFILRCVARVIRRRPSAVVSATAASAGGRHRYPPTLAPVRQMEKGLDATSSTRKMISSAPFLASWYLTVVQSMLKPSKVSFPSRGGGIK